MKLVIVTGAVVLGLLFLLHQFMLGYS